MAGQTPNCSVFEVLAHFSATSTRSTHLHGYNSFVIQETFSYLYTLGYEDSPKENLLQPTTVGSRVSTSHI